MSICVSVVYLLTKKSLYATSQCRPTYQVNSLSNQLIETIILV